MNIMGYNPRGRAALTLLDYLPKEAHMFKAIANCRRRICENLLLVLLVALPVFAPTFAQAAQDDQDTTIGVLGSDASLVWVIDLRGRDRENNCPFLHKLLKEAWGRAPLPPLQSGKTYPARVHMAPDGAEYLHSVFVNNSWFDVGMEMPYTCDQRPAPSGGHWAWENGQVALKPGADDPTPWQPAAGAQTAAPAEAASSVRINNQTSVMLTVRMDGGPGCTARPHEDCTFSASPGSHAFEASGDGFETSTQTQVIKPGVQKLLRFWKEE